jgi:hypothetical protein
MLHRRMESFGGRLQKLWSIQQQRRRRRHCDIVKMRLASFQRCFSTQQDTYYDKALLLAIYRPLNE